jgi:hypothetical protein
MRLDKLKKPIDPAPKEAIVISKRSVSDKNTG